MSGTPSLTIALVGHEPSVHVQRWAAWLVGRGHDVHVVTCGADAAAARDGGWTTHDLGVVSGGKLGYMLRIGAARRVIAGIAPDVIHAHHVTSYGMLARASCGDRPLVATCHGSDVLVSPERSFLLRRIVRGVLRRADAVTAPAEHVAAAARRVGGPMIATPMVLQYGVETRRLAAVGETSRLDRPSDNTLKLVVARAHAPVYRNHLVVEAVAELRSRGVDVRLDMYGGGPLESAITAQIGELGLDGHARVHGAVPPTELERCIAAADLCISASSSDGTSLALLETMALGTPALCVRIPATEAWIDDGVTGLLCDPSAISIADACQRLATLDVERLRAAAAGVVLERADRDICLGRIERLYVALAASTPERRRDAGIEAAAA